MDFYFKYAQFLDLNKSIHKKEDYSSYYILLTLIFLVLTSFGPSSFLTHFGVVFGLSRRAPFPKIDNSVLFSTSLSILLFFIVLFFTLFLPYSESWRNTKSISRRVAGPATSVAHSVEIVTSVRMSRAQPPP